MVEDYSNGLSIVPLDAYIADHWILSAAAGAGAPTHPWRALFKQREEPPPTTRKSPHTEPPPFSYCKEADVRGPVLRSADRIVKVSYTTPATDYDSRRDPDVHETIRLRDVEAFRMKTSCNAMGVDEYDVGLGAITCGFSCLSTSSTPIRPVIYRYIDVIKNSFALLEAIHFELFMPDRPDLRYLAVSMERVPADTAEGDYFTIADVDLLADPSFAVHLSKSEEYPVVWEVREMEKMLFGGMGEKSGVAYIMKRKANTRGGETAIGELSAKDFLIREPLFADGNREVNSIVRVTTRQLATARIYPVEPPLDRPKPSQSKDTVALGEEVEKPFDPRSEYLKRVSGIRTSSQRAGRVVTRVRALDADEEERIEDRLGVFTSYGEEGDLQLMDQLFKLGCQFRGVASRHADTKDVGEIRIDESIVLKTIMETGFGPLSQCRPLTDCIYGRRGATPALPEAPEPCPGRSTTRLQLNAQQARAVSAYMDCRGPRVFCIRSPPGSGKTTVAAAMAGTVAYSAGIQLLLSVQNVAVDNIGAALKKMGFRGSSVYNMKSDKKLDPHCPAPFDFFDQMENYELELWRTGAKPLKMEVVVKRRKKGKGPYTESVPCTYEDCLKFNRREYEKKLSPKILLGTIDMVLQKMYTFSKLCSDLGNVDRIIIDEASLLTESALFCIIRRFPEARIVLIGDDRQLPPFMYDEKILGHELAGRAALNVVMKNERVPVVELNKVYRAPPSLVAPYNRLAYEGRLVSMKGEGEYPLSDIGLVHSGAPQLLLIDVDGRDQLNEKTKSVYNEKELEALIRLLRKFPRKWTKDIMIICLYKDQKKRLQDRLNLLYEDDPVKEKQYTVLTVDSAQGKESPIVILLTTRTHHATDFFCSTERCNVSVSRQQKALIILGKASLLTTNKPWSTVVNEDDFTQKKDGDIK